MSRSTYIYLIALLAFPVSGLTVKAGLMARDTDLRERPSPLASVVANAHAEAELEVLERRGYWLQVKLLESGDEGWVRSIRVRYQARRAAPSAGSQENKSGRFFSSLARGATALVGGNASSSSRKTETTTIGIRGLSAEELTAAKPDPSAVQRMSGNRTTAVQAEAFAKAADLSAHDVSHTEE